jgi:hypothetical protein
LKNLGGSTHEALDLIPGTEEKEKEKTTQQQNPTKI